MSHVAAHALWLKSETFPALCTQMPRYTVLDDHIALFNLSVVGILQVCISIFLLSHLSTFTTGLQSIMLHSTRLTVERCPLLQVAHIFGEHGCKE